METHFYGYVLVDPETNIPRYVGITKQSLQQRFAGHVRDIYNRPDLNKHKTAWFRKLISKGLMPRIELIQEFSNELELKKFEVDYIAQHKDEYKLINQTPGGDFVAYRAHSRESILKKATTRAVTQYNVLGEKIADFEMTEDIARYYGLRSKACSHIMQCCKHVRTNAYGYLWRYKEDDTPLPHLSVLDVQFNKIVQYDQQMNRIAEYSSYRAASAAVGDGSHGSNILACCQGIQKTYKGYIFQLEPIFAYFDQDLYEARYVESLKMCRPCTNNRQAKKVNKFDLNGKFIAQYPSLLCAAESVKPRSGRRLIQECCEHKRLNYKNYIWEYAQGPYSPNSENELPEST